MVKKEKGKWRCKFTFWQEKIMIKKLLLFSLLFFLSCEDKVVEEQQVEENIQMFVNGSEIIAREY